MKLYTKTLGNSDKHLFLLHGLLGSSDNWQSFARLLSASYTVHLLDMRNHGRSPHSPEINYALMAEDVNAYIIENKIFQPIIMGHSMGGKIAMYMAIDFANILSQIIVVDIAPKTYSGGHEYIINAMRTTPLDNFSSRKEVELWLSDSIKGVGILQFIMKNLGRNMDNSFTWNCNIAAIANHYYDLMTFDAIGQSSIRADFIRGQLSDYIMPEDERLIKAFFPHHTIHTVADAGHWVHADNPEGFMQVLTKILLYT